MSSSIPIASLLKLIKVCCDKAEAVRSNKNSCALLADDLVIIHDILSGLSERDKISADQFKFSRVMNKIHRITTRSNVLFDRCLSGKQRIRIRHFLSTTSIKEELQKLETQVLIAISMLSLVFHVKQSSACSRGGTALPVVDESAFNDEDEQDTTAGEEYYLDEDDSDTITSDGVERAEKTNVVS